MHLSSYVGLIRARDCGVKRYERLELRAESFPKLAGSLAPLTEHPAGVA
jgi:hypothetical protein